MRLSVRAERSKARRVATVPVLEFGGAPKAMDRLRSWALTRGLPVESALSWTLAGDEPSEARCRIPNDVEVHPAVGIGVRRLPSSYQAIVEVPSGAHVETPKPEEVARQLEIWADESGYTVLGPAEIVPGRGPDGGYSLHLAVKRRPRRWTIEA